MISCGTSVAVAPWITKPTGRSGLRSAKFRQAMNASFTWPANRPVFMITSRATRSAFSTAQRRPIGPPQSCTTTVASRRSSCVEQPRHELDVAVVRVPVAVGRLVGAAEAGVVGADHAVPASTSGAIILRYR